MGPSGKEGAGKKVGWGRDKNQDREKKGLVAY